MRWKLGRMKDRRFRIFEIPRQKGKSRIATLYAVSFFTPTQGIPLRGYGGETGATPLEPSIGALVHSSPFLFALLYFSF
ncbi:hypothetical protein SODALDRAFT_136642 [Sodiomyces alkalinus F11]|uniref:Uncharacterized protein n=1 Tax=Sodiomyces alkalinus (strain CBS 110278 / VKM F-3762 / F11) TaxID=1314773 RepID=A0A3N2PYX3_SODAK|nr:hypothetical protein SODALDRAFT_136642 [Sodiomyces alkalinus F11]ROT39729.1 hypothetical protein SODALDRAFT_136642 [Sodiomyces alkalinus F11]